MLSSTCHEGRGKSSSAHLDLLEKLSPVVYASVMEM
jgi:hypothetical protein